MGKAEANTEPSSEPSTDTLGGKKVAFLGRLGGVNRREVQKIVRRQGGVAVQLEQTEPDLLVIGADELPLGEPMARLDESTRQRVAQGHLEILTETQFWQRLGLVNGEQHTRSLYTPAMLADLLNVSVSTIRRWHRRGLIMPSREVHRLPYFDFQEVATARKLAQLLAAGASPNAIEKQLAELCRYVPSAERSLAQLSIIVEGKRLLLRQGEGLIEPGGQLRIDFDALEQETLRDTEDPVALNVFRQPAITDEPPPSLQDMLDFAHWLEDEGELDQAVEMYRAALAACGPSASVCFQLAELLYRTGDVSAARERYFAAIELDEDFVEARANLGCVLAEQGQHELAIAAFKGALRYHDHYPDAHYHFARTLDELERFAEAEHHWRAFLRLAHDSPWAARARQRLGTEVP